jgi:hypothetical protein
MTKLTPARRGGLEALAARPTAARRSNRTDWEHGYVYWQTADWLVDQDLARRTGHVGDDQLALTDTGRTLCVELSIPINDRPPDPPPVPASPVEAQHRGHLLEWDPPHALSNVLRWTCANRVCGAAVLSYQGNVYGDATRTFCPCPSECGCFGPDDPDATECACDGPCTMSDTWVVDRTTPHLLDQPAMDVDCCDE